MCGDHVTCHVICHVILTMSTVSSVLSFIDSKASQSSLSREQSVEVIHLDVLRTFPTLGFFQEVSAFQNKTDVDFSHSK